MSNKLLDRSHKVMATLKCAMSRFSQIDGTQRAGAFAYYAFFALFPSLILTVSIASLFINVNRATRSVLYFLQNYTIISPEMKQQLSTIITNAINARGEAGVFAFLMLVWVGVQFFATLINATNRAWGIENDKWWKLPLRSLSLLGVGVSAVLLGIVVPVLARMAKNWLSPVLPHSFVYRSSVYVLSSLIFFICLVLFYKLAPLRTKRFAEVWIPALLVTVLLKLSEGVFVVYLKHFSNLDAIYGAAGGIMAMLLWIYISGWIFIFGACLCAVQAESKQSIPHKPKRVGRK